MATNHFPPLCPTCYVKYKRNSYRLQAQFFQFGFISSGIFHKIVTFFQKYICFIFKTNKRLQKKNTISCASFSSPPPQIPSAGNTRESARNRPMKKTHKSSRNIFLISLKSSAAAGTFSPSRFFPSLFPYKTAWCGFPRCGARWSALKGSGHVDRSIQIYPNTKNGSPDIRGAVFHVAKH